jgi:colicin import membrane protein
MAGDLSASSVAIDERSVPATGAQDRLSKWVGFSLVFHLVLIAALFIAPMLPSQRAPEYPIYSVDLVGGEKLGGTNLGTELSAPPVKPAAKKAEAPAPALAEERKTETKSERKEKVEKAPPKEKVAPPQETLALKQPTRKELAKKEPPQKADESDNALERVRERLIQSAAERAKNRTESAQTAGASPRQNPSSAAPPSPSTAPSKGQVISSGPGEGEGAAALGQGGRGGGVVKSIEFIAYRNRVLTTIRENWSWVPQRTDLKVTVHFGIRENGEIVGLKIVQASGDRTYDESVLRALRKSNPLPPPPESHRSDFMDYTITFTPKDLGA